MLFEIVAYSRNSIIVMDVNKILLLAIRRYAVDSFTIWSDCPKDVGINFSTVVWTVSFLYRYILDSQLLHCPRDNESGGVIFFLSRVHKGEEKCYEESPVSSRVSFSDITISLNAWRFVFADPRRLLFLYSHAFFISFRCIIEFFSTAVFLRAPRLSTFVSILKILSSDEMFRQGSYNIKNQRSVILTNSNFGKFG